MPRPASAEQGMQVRVRAFHGIRRHVLVTKQVPRLVKEALDPLEDQFPHRGWEDGQALASNLRRGIGSVLDDDEGDPLGEDLGERGVLLGVFPGS